MIIVGVGTGGTLTGLATRVKAVAPHVKIIGVDPEGSILAQPDHLNGRIHSYKVEGIGYDFVPRVLDRTMADKWIKTSDKESFIMARRLIREEGLLCGGSSGSAMVAACKAAKDLESDKTCVVILPDSVRNYMSKFVNDDWMVANRFMEDPLISWIGKMRHDNRSWREYKLYELKDWMAKPLSMFKYEKLYDALLMMKYKKQDWVVVQNDKYQMLGIVKMDDIMKMVLEEDRGDALKMTNLETRCTKPALLTLNASLGEIDGMLKGTNVVFIVKSKEDMITMAGWSSIELSHFIWAWHEALRL